MGMRSRSEHNADRVGLAHEDYGVVVALEAIRMAAAAAGSKKVDVAY